MRRKVFSHQKDSLESFTDTDAVIIMLSDFDEYKEELVKQRQNGQLTVGAFQNKSSAINVFIEYLLKTKNPEQTTNGEIKITARDVYVAFNEYIKERRPARHTLQTYLYYTRKALEHILLKKYNLLLSKTLGIEVFDIDFYLTQLSKSTLRSKGSQLKAFKKKEESKVISDERVKDALKWLAILRQERDSMAVEKLRLATLIVLLTGARGTEVNDLQFEVRVNEEVLKQIDLRKGIIYFHRKKLKADDDKNFTPVFIHPLLIEELKIFKKKHILDPTQPIFGYYSLDKTFKNFYTPNRAFKKRTQLENLYRKYEWLRNYEPQKPIITVKMFRKYFDSYLQDKIFELTGERTVTTLFGKGLEALDKMRRYKNYLLGRAEGVDFLHYISITEDKRYSSKLKKLNKMLIDGLIDKLMPELLYVLSEETRTKILSNNSEVWKFSESLSDFPIYNHK